MTAALLPSAARLAVLGLSLLSGACSTPPTAPGVLALPGTGRSLEQFNGDDLECRQRAGARVATSTYWAEQQRDYDHAYLQCMYAKGHRVPVPGQLTATPAAGPPPPPPGKPEPAPK